MSFDWTDYFTSAQEMNQLAPDSSICNAYYRNSISRAYYSAFCLARNQLREEGIYFAPSSNVHARVSLVYINSDEEIRLNIANSLEDLHKLRKEADYDDQIQRLAKKVGQALFLAQSIITNLNSIKVSEGEV